MEGSSDLLLRNDGNGAFPSDDIVRLPAACTLADRCTSAVALGDLNGDGRLDIVLAREGDPNMLLINGGHGQFTASALPGGSYKTTSIAIGVRHGATRPTMSATTVTMSGSAGTAQLAGVSGRHRSDWRGRGRTDPVHAGGCNRWQC